MEPNKFRESRLEINRMCENINNLIGQNDLEVSKECYQEVTSRLDKLIPKAEGEIQERSVKNLGIKLKGLSTQISKLKPKKKPAKKKDQIPDFIWDQERVGQLATVFLEKVFSNMGEDTDSKVCFGTTGKGIRPSYQIEFTSQDLTSFSGSSHNPLKKSLSSNAKKISKPFSYDVIESILRGK